MHIHDGRSPSNRSRLGNIGHLHDVPNAERQKRYGGAQRPDQKGIFRATKQARELSAPSRSPEYIFETDKHSGFGGLAQQGLDRQSDGITGGDGMPQPDHISIYDLPDPADLDADMRRYFEVCQEKLGIVPNVLKTYARHPEKLRNFVQTYNALMLGPSGLSKLEREMVAVVVSSANRCFYCLVAHGQAVRALSGDPQLGEMLVMNYRVAPLSPRHRAMLDFAWILTTAPWEVEATHRAALVEAGLNEAEMFDLADVIAFFNMSNRFAIASDMMPNPEYHARNR